MNASLWSCFLEMPNDAEFLHVHSIPWTFLMRGLDEDCLHVKFIILECPDSFKASKRSFDLHHRRDKLYACSCPFVENGGIFMVLLMNWRYEPWWCCPMKSSLDAATRVSLIELFLPPTLVERARALRVGTFSHVTSQARDCVEYLLMEIDLINDEVRTYFYHDDEACLLETRPLLESLLTILEAFKRSPFRMIVHDQDEKRLEESSFH